VPAETASITGASSGIGLELARLFAADEGNLVLVTRSKDKLETLAEKLRAEHAVEVVVLPADLADPAAARAIFHRLERQMWPWTSSSTRWGFRPTGSAHPGQEAGQAVAVAAEGGRMSGDPIMLVPPASAANRSSFSAPEDRR
jgi:NAD(P)-dependent dehydrogenase (short-subunit alcohol dehydrogenase family)